MMATSFLNVIITTINDNGDCNRKYNSPIYIQFNDSAGNILKIQFYSEQGGTLLHEVNLTSSCEFASLGSQSLIVTLGPDGWILRFPSQADLQRCQSLLKNFRTKLKNSVFTQRTEESSAMQYFQFYGYLSQQQNMMQDYIRTSTYQRAILANISDFKDKIVLDVGAGSGILSFFAIQAGARKVYAVEASSMAEQAQNLVFANKCAGKIVVISGKIEEINLPEKVDVIISEPMGYMLFNERMLETYLHAKKWLIPDGKMYPAKSDLHVAPFSDDTLYMEQYNKANFWYQTCFHGVDLTRLRDAAINEYFRQPIVDTFDIRICMARSQKHTVDFLLANEQDLHKIVIPLEFTMLTSGTVHGLAFWFDVAFVGSAQTIWLSTSPTEPLTHWYQVRCLLHNPVFVKEGQILTGRVALIANVRQSYDVEMELCVAETGTRSVNTLDLKNPYFRYTGQAPTPPPGNNTTSPSENYWQQIDATNSQTSINGIVVNGVDELSMQAQNNFVNVGNSDQHLGQQRAAQSRLSANMPNTSLGGGVSPAIFTQQQQQVVMGNTSHYPVNTSFMIGDYVTPGNIIIPTQGMQASYR